MGIGKRIKEARENMGLTQSELADLVGVTGSAITNYEKENSHPKESVLYKLFDALKVDANYLFQDVADISENTNAVTISEFSHIKKYRQLDSHGKRIIDLLLNEEYKRCTENIGIQPPILDISYEDTECPSPIIEKETTDLLFPQKDLAAIKKVLEQHRIKKA